MTGTDKVRAEGARRLAERLLQRRSGRIDDSPVL